MNEIEDHWKQSCFTKLTTKHITICMSVHKLVINSLNVLRFWCILHYSCNIYTNLVQKVSLFATYVLRGKKNFENHVHGCFPEAKMNLNWIFGTHANCSRFLLKVNLDYSLERHFVNESEFVLTLLLTWAPFSRGKNRLYIFPWWSLLQHF